MCNSLFGPCACAQAQPHQRVKACQSTSGACMCPCVQACQRSLCVVFASAYSWIVRQRVVPVDKWISVYWWLVRQMAVAVISDGEKKRWGTYAWKYDTGIQSGCTSKVPLSHIHEILMLGLWLVFSCAADRLQTCVVTGQSIKAALK